MDKSLWKSIAEKSWAALLAGGLFLLITGATEKVIYFNTAIANPYFAGITMFFGAILIAASVYMIYIERSPARDSAIKEFQLPDPKVFWVTITTPKTLSVVNSPLSIKGSTKKLLPTGWQLWLFNQGEFAGDTAYWPQSQVIIKGKEWSVTYNPSHLAGDSRRRLKIFMVGKDGRALIACYKKLNRHFAQPGMRWQGIGALTSDMLEVSADLVVQFSEEAASSARP